MRASEYPGPLEKVARYGVLRTFKNLRRLRAPRTSRSQVRFRVSQVLENYARPREPRFLKISRALPGTSGHLKPCTFQVPRTSVNHARFREPRSFGNLARFRVPRTSGKNIRCAPKIILRIRNLIGSSNFITRAGSAFASPKLRNLCGKNKFCRNVKLPNI